VVLTPVQISFGAAAVDWANAGAVLKVKRAANMKILRIQIFSRPLWPEGLIPFWCRGVRKT
jgi:hypothetical protein